MRVSGALLSRRSDDKKSVGGGASGAGAAGGGAVGGGAAGGLGMGRGAGAAGGLVLAGLARRPKINPNKVSNTLIAAPNPRLAFSYTAAFKRA